MARRRQKVRLNSDAVIQHGIKLQIESPLRTLSPKEVGQLMGVTGEAVKYWIRSGQLKAFRRANGFWRIETAELQSFIKLRNEEAPKYAIVAVRNAIQRIVESALKSLSLVPLCSSSLADALSKARKTSALLFIIDVGWREASRLIHEIRVRRYSQHALILLTSASPLSPKQLELALDAKISGCMVEPITVDALKAELQRLHVGELSKD